MILKNVSCPVYCNRMGGDSSNQKPLTYAEHSVGALFPDNKSNSCGQATCSFRCFIQFQ